MTIPWLMNCSHQSDGWCLECIKTLGEENAHLCGVLFDIAETGHNAADMAPEWIGLPDRWEKLATLLADKAHQALQPLKSPESSDLDDFEAWMARQFRVKGDWLHVEPLSNATCLTKEQTMLLALHISNQVRAMPPTLIEQLREAGDRRDWDECERLDAKLRGNAPDPSLEDF